MVCVAGAILIDDGRPVLFRQARLGRGRRTFEIVKFRSMRDGRVTRVGRLLRATGLDELPQFVNILRGDLSAVGPRPITEEDARRFGWTGPSAAARWRVKPGLTGLGQLAGRSPRESPPPGPLLRAPAVPRARLPPHRDVVRRERPRQVPRATPALRAVMRAAIPPEGGNYKTEGHSARGGNQLPPTIAGGVSCCGFCPNTRIASGIVVTTPTSTSVRPTAAAAHRSACPPPANRCPRRACRVWRRSRGCLTGSLVARSSRTWDLLRRVDASAVPAR